jgi:four helix bundle protein
MRDFRHIRAWQRAHALSIAIHRLARDFSRKGHAHLRAQLAHAAHSVATNIVEGCGAATHKEFARFLDISIKSANETEYHLLASHDLELISDADWERYTKETIEVRKMIHAYRVAVLRDEGGPEHAVRATDRRPRN